MNKHKLHGLWNRFQAVSIWILVALFLGLSFAAVIALRQNNTTMIKLREAVYAADAQDGDVEAALRELRSHVYSHMNTNLRAGSTSSEPPIQLVGRFNRFVAAEEARVAALGGNAKVFSDAQAACNGAPLSERSQCLRDYVVERIVGQYEIKVPPKEFYTFDFASPRWSPDMAGLLLVAAALSGVLLVARLISGIFIKRYLAK